MSKICRVTDYHKCGSEDIEGSKNVFVNKLASHRKGDADSHGGVQVGCSNNVFVNNRGVARVGDLHSGDSVPHSPSPEAVGSDNVFVNGY